MRLRIFDCPVHHLRQGLRDEDGDLLDVRSGIGHHLFRHVHRDSVAMDSTMAPLPCETLTSHVECRGLIVCGGGVLWCVVCEQPTASSPKGARVFCGF